jgi:hypothetical protein
MKGFCNGQGAARENACSPTRRLTRRRAATLALLASTAALFAGPAVASAAQPGAIFAQNQGCTDNGTVTKFASKEDLYIQGSNLTRGEYYVNVTTPDGQPLGTSDPATVTVDNDGNLPCLQVWSVTEFTNTTNNGGVYSVSVSISSLADGTGPKQKNFKIAEGGVPQQTLITVQKFYDTNTDGLHNNFEPLIMGWEVEATNSTDTFADVTTWNIFLDSGAWTISERDPVEANWFATTDKSFAIDVPKDDRVKFGNVCTGGGGGGLTLGFWSNKNGQALVGADDLSMLRLLNLRNANGNHFDPTGYAAFRTWLLNANATNMAYMLSAQLAAMKLNVHNGKVDGSSLIYAPGATSANGAGFATVSDVITEANTSLANDGHTLAASAVRSYQEELKNALDNANNNLNFVQGQPCAFSFAP